MMMFGPSLLRSSVRHPYHEPVRVDLGDGLTALQDGRHDLVALTLTHQTAGRVLEVSQEKAVANHGLFNAI